MVSALVQSGVLPLTVLGRCLITPSAAEISQMTLPWGGRRQPSPISLGLDPLGLEIADCSSGLAVHSSGRGWCGLYEWICACGVICWFVYLSVISVPLHLFDWLFYLFIYLSVYFICLFTSVYFIYLFTYLFILSIYLHVCLYICLSNCHSVYL